MQVLPLPTCLMSPCMPRHAATWWTFEKCKYYTVQAGDTLDSISGALGLTALELKEANPGVTMLQARTLACCCRFSRLFKSQRI